MTWRAMPGSTWQDRAPAMLRDTFTGPSGEPCMTTTDRRWLWRLESYIGVTAPSGGPLDAMRRDLLEYLRETCEHHWDEFEAGGDFGAHRQCLWCNEVEWLES